MQTTFAVTPFSRWLIGRRYGSRPICRRHELGGRQLLTISFPTSGRITCISGRIWITRDGDTADFVMGDGDSLVCDRHTRAVIEALDSSVIEIIR